MSRVIFGLLWCVHWLPLWMMSRIGSLAGRVAYRLVAERRRVTLVNLEKCFPALTPAAREQLAQAHWRAFVRAFVERSILWWGSRGRVARTVRLEGLEHAAGGRVILLAPHFVGLDMGFTRIALERDVAMLHSRQKDPRFERLLHRGRSRFGRAWLYTRQQGVRASLKALESGALYYYLPDLDYGAHRAVFVPFFGVPAATVTGLSFIARETGARVVPCVTRMLPGGEGYVTRFYPAWKDFPGSDPAADARRMNAFIEDRVREMPEQYYWMHKRFKTRPEGEARFY